jgi:hypothetical protein
MHSHICKNFLTFVFKQRVLYFSYNLVSRFEEYFLWTHICAISQQFSVSFLHCLSFCFVQQLSEQPFLFMQWICAANENWQSLCWVFGFVRIFQFLYDLFDWFHFFFRFDGFAVLLMFNCQYDSNNLLGFGVCERTMWFYTILYEFWKWLAKHCRSNFAMDWQWLTWSVIFAYKCNGRLQMRFIELD